MNPQRDHAAAPTSAIPSPSGSRVVPFPGARDPADGFAHQFVGVGQQRLVVDATGERRWWFFRFDLGIGVRYHHGAMITFLTGVAAGEVIAPGPPIRRDNRSVFTEAGTVAIRQSGDKSPHSKDARFTPPSNVGVNSRGLPRAVSRRSRRSGSRQARPTNIETAKRSQFFQVLDVVE
jgi:hypothetical protein